MTQDFLYASLSSIRKECLNSFSEWAVPTGDEVKIALRLSGLTAESFSNLIGVEGRTVRRWTCDEVSIPYVSWCILCLEAGASKFWGKSDNIIR